MTAVDERAAQYDMFRRIKAAGMATRLQVIRCRKGHLWLGAYRVNGRTVIVTPPHSGWDEEGNAVKRPGQAWVDERPLDPIGTGCRCVREQFGVVDDTWRLHVDYVGPTPQGTT